MEPTVRWFIAYVAALLAGSVVMGVALVAILALRQSDGLPSMLVAYVVTIVPAAAALLFLPVALASAALRFLGLWHMGGFVGMGLALAALGIWLFLSLAGPSANPQSGFILAVALIIAGAAGGAAFGWAWNRTGTDTRPPLSPPRAGGAE